MPDDDHRSVGGDSGPSGDLRVYSERGVLPKRLTSLAIVIALSGSPAVLSACMALCLQGVVHGCIAHGQPVGGTCCPLSGGSGRRLSPRASWLASVERVGRDSADDGIVPRLVGGTPERHLHQLLP